MAAVLLLLAAAAALVAGEGIVILDRPASSAGDAAFPRFAEARAAEAQAPVEALARGGVKPVCDLTAESGICLYKGRRVLTPQASEKELVVRWSFDEVRVVDHSGYQNHGDGFAPTGPGRLGLGNSATFEDEASVVAPPSPSLLMATQRTGLSLWVNLRQNTDPNSEESTTFVALASPKQSVLELGMVPKTGELTVSVSGKPVLRSFARIRPNRWHHVAVSRSHTSVTLYLNGIPDATAALTPEEAPAPDDVSLRVGSRPGCSPPACRAISILIDDVQLFARPLLGTEVEAMSFPALGAVEPSYLRLGGLSRTWDEAAKGCPESYRLCSPNDLSAGALQTAVTMGWIRTNDPLWLSTDDRPTKDATEKRVALCCS